MTPITITKRLVKGTPLTAEEHDNNLQGLKTACEELNIEKYGKSNLAYNAERYAISGAINKVNRNFTFQETTANSVIVGAEMKYFKSLDKVLNGASATIKFPQAPVATNRVINGTFDTDIAGWIPGPNTVLEWENGTIRATTNDTDGAYFGREIGTFPVGTELVIEALLIADTDVPTVFLGTGVGSAGGMEEQTIRYANGYYTNSAIVNTTSPVYISCYGGVGATAGFSFRVGNIAVFPAEELLCYDNLLLKDDGTYVITRTEQNQYITMDTMLNYTSKLYNVVDGSDTGTTITMTNDATVEEYTESDGHKYITIGADKRFNQGLYHPVFNEFGTKKASDDKYWYDTAQSFLSIADCFNPAKLLTASGNYASGKSGRPDGKYYDIIYGESFIDQRWDAAWKIGSKELTTKERDLDISAGKFADFVGSATWETKNLKSRLTTGRSQNGVFESVGYVITDGNFNDLVLYESYIITKVGKAVLTFSNGGEANWLPISSANSSAMSTQLNLDVVEYGLLVCTPSRLRYGSNTFVHTDIVGNPANYPAVWKDALSGGESIAGTPLLVGENRENYAEGVQSIKFSKKFTALGFADETYLTISTGVWLSYPGHTIAGLNRNSNTRTSYPVGDYIVLESYQAYNNNLVPTVNSKVVGGSAGVSDVATNYYFGEGDYIYSHLGNNLLNKVCTDPDGSDIGFTTPLTGSNWAKVPMRLIGANITHAPISMHATVQPVVKLYSYLSDGATRHKQVYTFKEMKFDGPPVNQDGGPAYSFGDNNKFSAADNLSTTSDNNGNTILLGQKARLLDYRVKE